jgi:uncharacterized protein YndB with AHSA1/START domain
MKRSYDSASTSKPTPGTLRSDAVTKHVEVSREIKASPEVVWAAISDITRMGEWSPECHTCEWNEGFSGPEVGARFTGHNRNGEFEWSTECEVTESVPGERFAFDGVFGDLRFAKWAYVIEPTDGGSRVTEIWDEGRPDEIMEFTAKISGVTDRGEHNRKGMEATLERLAAAVE